jgi:hypothetical protein
VYADYDAWPEMFPTISAVRVRQRVGTTLVLEVEHIEGLVINELERAHVSNARSAGEVDVAKLGTG